MRNNISRLFRPLGLIVALVAGAAGASAQSSLPAPGSGGSYNPAPSPGWGGPAYGGPAYGGGWGNPWGPGYMGPDNAFVNGPGWQNAGTLTVMSCGYDVYGVWRNLPLRVYYRYNGIDYDVTVLSAWNPWSDTWNNNLQVPAYNTSYYTHGNNYDFYTVLASGTYYFNL